jgi:hypothetical protein
MTIKKFYFEILSTFHVDVFTVDLKTAFASRNKRCCCIIHDTCWFLLKSSCCRYDNSKAIIDSGPQIGGHPNSLKIKKGKDRNPFLNKLFRLLA